MNFIPDYTNILSAVNNVKLSRLPLYEHLISPGIMEKVLRDKFVDIITGTLLR